MESKQIIESKLPEVGTTIFTVMSALANAHGAINLSQGFPDFPIDKKLSDFIVEGLNERQVQYAPMPGRLDLREAIARKIELQHHKNIDPVGEITVTAGATEAIYSIITAVVREGDEVILFDPAYDCYDPAIRLQRAHPVHLKLVHPEYSINWDEVAEKVTNNTRLIIVNNPHNPCGSVWNENDLSALEKLLLKFPNLLVLSDEVYEHIQFDGVHQSVLISDLIRSRAYVVYSFGKTFHVTGWKIGYCIAPPELTEELRKVHQFNVFCVNNTMQYAIAKYLEQTDEWKKVSPLYHKKRDLFLDAMKSSRFKPLNCGGTYFILMDYSAISSESDIDFTQRMTKEFGVASIPVSVFYEDKTDNKVIRFCFAKEDQTLLNAAEKLCKI